MSDRFWPPTVTSAAAQSTCVDGAAVRAAGSRPPRPNPRPRRAARAGHPRLASTDRPRLHGYWPGVTFWEGEPAVRGHARLVHADIGMPGKPAAGDRDETWVPCGSVPPGPTTGPRSASARAGAGSRTAPLFADAERDGRRPMPRSCPGSRRARTPPLFRSAAAVVLEHRDPVHELLSRPPPFWVLDTSPRRVGPRRPCAAAARPTACACCTSVCTSHRWRDAGSPEVARDRVDDVIARRS